MSLRERVGSSFSRMYAMSPSFPSARKSFSTPAAQGIQQGSAGGARRAPEWAKTHVGLGWGQYGVREPTAILRVKFIRGPGR
eukprot:1194920-Prorocentrum_minimum.AAC.8